MVSAQATTEPAPEPRPGPTGMSLLLGPFDEVGDDQEIARKAHPDDDVDLEIEPVEIGLALVLGRARHTARAAPSRPARASRRSCAASASTSPARLGRIGLRLRRARTRSAARPRAYCRSPRAGRRTSARMSAAGLIQASGEDLTRSSRSIWLDWAMHSIASCARWKFGVGEAGRVGRDQRQVARIGEVDQALLRPRCSIAIAAPAELDIEPVREQALQPCRDRRRRRRPAPRRAAGRARPRRPRSARSARRCGLRARRSATCGSSSSGRSRCAARDQSAEIVDSPPRPARRARSQSMIAAACRSRRRAGRRRASCR